MDKARAAAVVASRMFGTSARARAQASLKEPFNPAKNQGVIPDSAGYDKVVRMQKQMAVDDGHLVWQKKGLVDQVPYGLSLLGSLAGVGFGVYLILAMSFPAKK